MVTYDRNRNKCLMYIICLWWIVISLRMERRHAYLRLDDFFVIFFFFSEVFCLLRQLENVIFIIFTAILHTNDKYTYVYILRLTRKRHKVIGFVSTSMKCVPFLLRHFLLVLLRFIVTKLCRNIITIRLI